MFGLYKYRSTVDTSDELWQASSIRGIDGSDLCKPRIHPRYKKYMCVTHSKSTYIFCLIVVSSQAQVSILNVPRNLGAKFDCINPC